MALDRVFSTPKMEIDQERYEELIRAELKCKQYKAEFERQGQTVIIDIVESKKLEVCVNTESEEKQDE
ncbi:MAG: hypothetical protein ACLU84_06870 [Clostridia bacterium]